MNQEPSAASQPVERWLRQKESQILPLWMRELCHKRQALTKSSVTRDLQDRIFVIYYDRLCHAMREGETLALDRMLLGLVADHFRQQYDITEILHFPLLLKSILWRAIAREFSPTTAESMMDQLEPVLDHSAEILVQAYARETQSSLNQRLEELDLLARRLATSNQETERAFEQLHSLYNISKAISGSTLEIHETLETIADNLVALPAIERCVIWLATSKTTLQVGAIKGEGDLSLGSLTLSLGAPKVGAPKVGAPTSFVCRALLTLRQQQFESPEDTLAPFLADRHAMAIPMYNENRPVGVVMINGRPDELPFDPSTISLIQVATEQAAVALENAQLYSSVMRFNQELEEMVHQRTAQLESANQELERVNRDLERLDRTKSDFISIAAHELKTPLTLIQGYTNIMREDATIQGRPFLVNLLNGIINGSTRLYGIIESMIDVSLIDSQVLQLRPAQTSVSHLLRTAANQYTSDLEQRQLTLRMGKLSLPYIEADGQRLYQVFDNLLVNAIKYTPDGGEIEIDAWVMEPQAGTDWIEIVVRDTGIGIDPADHERIFDKFYQTGEVALHSSGKTKFKGGGPGLGLAIAKGIIQAHGGQIWVESTGHDEEMYPGSQFHVILPVQSMIQNTQIASPFSYTATPAPE